MGIGRSFTKYLADEQVLPRDAAAHGSGNSGGLAAVGHHLRDRISGAAAARQASARRGLTRRTQQAASLMPDPPGGASGNVKHPLGQSPRGCFLLRLFRLAQR